jgi:hypothetical protein
MATGQKTLNDLWLKALLFVLLGYDMLGKGFAYLFLGEMTLIIGFLIFLTSRRAMVLFSDSILFLWAVFAFWGICRTVPYLSQYRFAAVRDAAIWGYGLAALLVVSFVNRSSQISRALNTYRKFLRWFLPIFPILFVASLTIGPSLLTIPWADGISILHIKSGDAAVAISSAALFMLIFPDRRLGMQKGGASVYRIIGVLGLSGTAIFVALENRGGFLSIILPMALVTAMTARRAMIKVASIAIVWIMLAVGFFAIAPSNLVIAHKTVNADRVLDSFASIAGGSGKGTGHEGTAEWRLVWWRNIVSETFYGPFFWNGRGFGVNLAVADGPLGAKSEDDVALRSPHNGSMSILARMGVPGFTIWIAINLLFAARMFLAHRRAARLGEQFWSNLNLWILGCWLAVVVNMSFDVYIEGPIGGIWFWSLIGLGVAALRIQKHESRVALSLARANAANVELADFANA